VNIDFNYYNFLKQKQLKYDIKIDLSGLDVKGDATTLEKDENNEISEVNLAEVVDNNINFVYTYCPSAINQRFSYMPLDENGDPVLDGEGNPVTAYRLIGEAVTETDLIDFTVTNPNYINLNGVGANIIPKYTRFANNTYPIVEKGVFAALGLVSNNKYNIESLPDSATPYGIPVNLDLGKPDFRYKGHITKKLFYKRINQLREAVENNGVEIVTNEYMADIGEDGIDKNSSGVNLFYNFFGARVKAPQFIEKKLADGGMESITADDITPFNMSVKDVFKAYFISSDELYDSFIEELTALIKAINSSAIVNSFVDEEDINLTKQFVVDPSLAETLAYNPITLKSELVVTDTTAAVPFAKYVTTEDSEVPGGVKFVLDKNNNKKFEYEYVLPTETNINEIIDILPKLKKQVNRAASAVIGAAFVSAGFGAVAVALAYESISDAKDSLRELNVIIRNIRWYQHYTNESVFPDRQFIKNFDTDDSTIPPVEDENFIYDKQLCRLLVPVYMGTKRKKIRKKGLFGRKYTTYRKVDLGVRWVEVNFVDTNTYTKYRKNDEPLGIPNDMNISISALNGNGTYASATLSSTLPTSIMNKDPMPETVIVTISGCSNETFNGTFDAKIIDSTHITYTAPTNVTFSGNTSGGVLNKVLMPFDTTKPSDDPKNIKVNYAMPHLPYDSELRKQVFSDFGSFDQSSTANKNRNGDYTYDMAGNIVLNADIPGWEIFHESSKSINTLRSGIDIYNKVEFLLKILEAEFGKSRVHLIETMRSTEDQDKLQLGGDVSTFLSWHNYGLSVKIRITKDDNITAIEDGTPDMMRLLNIAEAYIDGVKNGYYGEPLNVIWCGQLVTGPDLFVWEFLPIGVNHKDALKFRDAAFTQQDPVITNAYVNVTEAGYLVTDGNDITAPYVKIGSKAANTGITINGDLWVDPKKITNYAIPSDLVLKDVKEFLLLIDGKMKSNGTSLMGRQLVSEWKSGNPKSFNQLVIFYSLIGNYSATRGLLAGDYIERFSNIVTKYYKTDPIKFVQLYLGDYYYNIQIKIDELPDGSYITLYDGKLTTPILEARSMHREGNGNTFGQKQLDFNHVQFGQYQDGIFIPEGDAAIVNIKSETSVIDGYADDGTPINKDALVLHSLISDQLYKEYTEIVELFNNLKIKFMYDTFYNSPNYEFIDYLENEFGVINTQDLLTFDQLRDMYARININNKKTDPDGTVRGAGANIEDMYTDGSGESVYEKLVSNSQLVGARRAKLTREKPIIEPLKNGLNVEKVIAQLKKSRMPSVRDIL